MAEESIVESIFYAALEKRLGDERASFLRAACADDPNLRHRVELLLAAQPHLGRFLENQAVSIVACQIASGAIGNQLGPYTLLRQLGRGGMGVVYEAEQITLGRRRRIARLRPHRRHRRGPKTPGQLLSRLSTGS